MEVGVARNGVPITTGARVRVIGTPSGVKLATHLGTVVGSDQELDGYYVVRLDEPAISYCSGADEPLPEILEADDTLIVLPG